VSGGRPEAPAVRLRPVAVGDLDLLRRFATQPELNGPDWTGFRDAGAVARRFAEDGYLGPDAGRLMVLARAGAEQAGAEQAGAEESDAAKASPDESVVGVVSWVQGGFGAGRYWIIGVVLLPEWRGHGIGWRAQDLLCEYLFAHTPAERIEAGTQPENLAEQRSLVKAGFTREGVLRSAQFRAGAWRDLIIYSRLRGEQPPGTPTVHL
jgi:ribosomal-protein-alanine N-acetyltransferase